MTFGGSASVDLALTLGFATSPGQIDTDYPNFTAELVVGSSDPSNTGAWTFGGGTNNDEMDGTSAPWAWR